MVIFLSLLAVGYFIMIAYFFTSGKLSTAEFLSVVGVIPLSVIALFQEQFKRRWFAPILKLDFKLEAPYCSKTPFYLRWKDSSGVEHKVATEAYYFRFGVTNKGKSQARLCEVFIADLQEYKEKTWHGVEYFQQVNLKWDTGKSQDAYMHINPSQIRLLSDIGHIIKSHNDLPESVENTKIFHLDYLYSIGGYQPGFLKPNTKYKFKITVVSENAVAISKTFEFYWNGLWKDSQEEMFKEMRFELKVLEF